MKNRFLILTALLLMVLAIFALNTAAYAEGEATDPVIWVGGVAMSDGDYLASSATEVTATQPESGYAHYADGVLALNAYTYSGVGHSEKKAVIYTESDLTIVVSNTSTITQTKSSYGIWAHNCDLTIGDSDSSGILTINAPAHGVYVNSGNLTVTDCDLQIDAGSCGLYAKKDLSISGCTADVTAYQTAIYCDGNGDVGITIGDSTLNLTATGSTADGIYAYGDNVQISNSNAEITAAGNYGIHASAGNIIIEKSSISATAQRYGMRASKGVSITNNDDNVIDVTVGGKDGHGITSISNLAITGGTVNIKASGTDVYGLKTSTHLTIADCDLTVEAGSYGMYAGNSVTISGSTLDVTAGNHIIYSQSVSADDITIEDSSLTLKATGDTCNGIYLTTDNIAISNSDVTITGTANGIYAESGTVTISSDSGNRLKINAGQIGLRSYKDLSISGYSVNIAAEHNAIKGYGAGKTAITIANSALTLKATGNPLYYGDCIEAAGKDIVIRNSDVTITDSRNGIYAPIGKITISSESGNHLMIAAGHNGLYASSDLSLTGCTGRIRSTASGAADDMYSALRCGGTLTFSAGMIRASTEYNGTPGEYVEADAQTYDLIVIEKLPARYGMLFLTPAVTDEEKAAGCADVGPFTRYTAGDFSYTPYISDAYKAQGYSLKTRFEVYESQVQDAEIVFAGEGSSFNPKNVLSEGTSYDIHLILELYNKNNVLSETKTFIYTVHLDTVKNIYNPKLTYVWPAVTEEEFAAREATIEASSKVYTFGAAPYVLPDELEAAGYTTEIVTNVYKNGSDIASVKSTSGFTPADTANYMIVHQLWITAPDRTPTIYDSFWHHYKLEAHVEFGEMTPAVTEEQLAEGSVDLGTLYEPQTFSATYAEVPEWMQTCEPAYEVSESMHVYRDQGNGERYVQTTGMSFTPDLYGDYRIQYVLKLTRGGFEIETKQFEYVFTYEPAWFRMENMSPTLTSAEFAGGLKDLGLVEEAIEFSFDMPEVPEADAALGYKLNATMTVYDEARNKMNVYGTVQDGRFVYNHSLFGKYRIVLKLYMYCQPEAGGGTSYNRELTYRFDVELNNPYKLEFLNLTPAITEAEAAAGKTKLGTQEAVTINYTYPALPQWMADAGFTVTAYVYDYTDGVQTGFFEPGFKVIYGGNHELVATLKLANPFGHEIEAISHTYTCYIPPAKATEISIAKTQENLQIPLSEDYLGKLQVTVLPQNAVQKAIFTSSNENVVKVAEDGTITPVGYGRAVITITDVDGLVSTYSDITVIGGTFIVDGTTLQLGQYLEAGTHKLSDTKPGDSYAYYAESETGAKELVLHNYTFSGLPYAIGEYSYLIYAKEPIVVNIEGSNRMSAEYSAGIGFGNGGMIRGGADDTLEISAYKSGIISGGGIDLVGGKVVIDAELYGMDVAGDVNIQDGSVEVTGREAIKTTNSGNLTVYSGKLLAVSDTTYDSDNSALNVAGGAFWYKGALAIGSTESNGNACEIVDGASMSSYDYVHISDDDVHQHAIELDDVYMFDGCYKDQNSSVTTAAPATGSYAYYKDGVLTLNNYCRDSDTGIYYNYRDLTIRLKGHNEISNIACSDYKSDGKWIDPNLTIKGSGNINIGHAQWMGCAIEVGGRITFCSDTVVECVESDAICDAGEIVVNGADVSVYSYCDRYAGATINGCEAPITVRNGNLYLYSEVDNYLTDSYVANPDEVTVYAKTTTGDFTDDDIIDQVSDPYDLQNYCQVKIVYGREDIELNTMTLPAALKEIEDEAFIGTAADEIILPDGCETIGARAFANSANLQYVYMPNSVKNIAENAFDDCDNVAFICESENDAADYAVKHGIPYKVK